MQGTGTWHSYESHWEGWSHSALVTRVTQQASSCESLPCHAATHPGLPTPSEQILELAEFLEERAAAVMRSRSRLMNVAQAGQRASKEETI